MNPRQAIESTYDSLADVYRRSTSKDAATGQTKQGEVMIFANVPCALSQNRSGTLHTGNGYGKTNSTHTLFCSPDLELFAGDRFVITDASGRKNILRAGKPFCYSSHQEVPLSEEARA